MKPSPNLLYRFHNNLPHLEMKTKTLVWSLRGNISIKWTDSMTQILSLQSSCVVFRLNSAISDSQIPIDYYLILINSLSKWFLGVWFFSRIVQSVFFFSDTWGTLFFPHIAKFSQILHKHKKFSEHIHFILHLAKKKFGKTSFKPNVWLLFSIFLLPEITIQNKI